MCWYRQDKPKLYAKNMQHIRLQHHDTSLVADVRLTGWPDQSTGTWTSNVAHIEPHKAVLVLQDNNCDPRLSRCCLSQGQKDLGLGS